MLGSNDPSATTVVTDNGTVTVTPVNGNSFVITRKGAPTPSGVKGMRTFSWSDGNRAEFRGRGYSVRVDKHTGAVAFVAENGDTLLYEKTPNAFAAARGTGFYGAGERGHSLRLNGDSLIQWNRPNYGYGEGDPRLSQMGITMPYMLSDHGFGILFNDPSRSSIAFKGNSPAASEFVYETENAGPVSYTFIGGGDMPSVTSNFTAVAGRQDLPPFWSLGYITSKYGYHTDKEALGAIDSLKRAGYPVDGIIFDLYWYGKETDMGRLEWNKQQFPDHRAMLDSLNAMGVNTVLIHQPFVNKIGAIDNYNMLKEGNMLTTDSAGNVVDADLWIGASGILDMSNPDTQRWLWNRLRTLTADGVAGWWGDLGEPEKHPLNIRHTNGKDAVDYHNVFGNEWSRLIYEGLRKDYPAMRPFLMMRGGSTGLQQYSVFPWTGDVARSWAGLQPQIKLMLNSGLSGLGYMSSDIGGFAVDQEHPTDPELYLRWMQLGVFNPILRTHAQAAPEPYHYPAQAALLNELVRMRYRWLPYNYTLAYQNAANGEPMARPVNYYGDKSGKIGNVVDEYLWGDEVLVAPVMTKGARTRTVLFPDLGKSGADTPVWIDWFNPARSYKGGTSANVPVSLKQFPLYVKAGSFIPQYMEKIDNVRQYNPAKLTVRYYAGPVSSSYTMYDDDRVSPTSLADGQYALIRFEGNGKSVTITPTGSYKGMPAQRDITLEVISKGRSRSYHVTVADKPVTVTLR